MRFRRHAATSLRGHDNTHLHRTRFTALHQSYLQARCCHQRITIIAKRFLAPSTVGFNNYHYVKLTSSAHLRSAAGHQAAPYADAMADNLRAKASCGGGMPSKRFSSPSTLPWGGPICSPVSSSGLPSSRKMRSYWRESSGGLRG